MEHLKNILYVIPTTTVGDSEIKLLHCLNMVNKQNLAKITVGFVYENPLQKKLEGLNISCIYYAGPPGMIQAIQINNYDVIHVYSSKKIIELISANKPSYTKLIETIFDHGTRIDNTRTINPSIVDHTIFDTEYLQQKFNNRSGTVINYGIDTQLLMRENKQVIRKRYNLRDGVKSVAIIEQKTSNLDIKFVINLGLKLKQKAAKCKLVVFCKDQVKKILNNKIRAGNLENFIVVDSTENPPLGGLDILLDTSEIDRLNTRIFEALCYQIPIVLRDTEINRQIASRQKISFLYKANDPVELIERYLAAASNLKITSGLDANYHAATTASKLASIYNDSVKTSQPIMEKNIPETYCIIPYQIYGGAEVYLENHIKKQTFENLHLVFLSNNKLKQKVEGLVKTTTVGNLTELGNFLLQQKAKKAMFYNSASVYNLLKRVKKINNIHLTEIVHSYHSWSDSMHNTVRGQIEQIYVVSQTVAKQWKIPKFKVLFPTIDESRFKLPKVKSDKTVIGTVARFSAEKNLTRIVDIAANLDDSYRFVIVGSDGGAKQQLINYIKQKGLQSRFELKPHSDTVEEEYARFDMFLLTSKVEGTPITILEAQAAGLPVVAPDVGSIKEMCEGKPGHVFRQSDDNRKIARMINRTVKFERRKQSAILSAPKKIKESKINKKSKETKVSIKNKKIHYSEVSSQPKIENIEINLKFEPLIKRYN